VLSRRVSAETTAAAAARLAKLSPPDGWVPTETDEPPAAPDEPPAAPVEPSPSSRPTASPSRASRSAGAGLSAREFLTYRLPAALRHGRWELDLRAVAALAAVALCGAALGGIYLWQSRPTVLPVPTARAEVVQPAPSATDVGSPAAALAPPAAPPTTGAIPAAPPPAATAALVVDVQGKVRTPGLVSLPPGSRVADALAAAGGARPRADTSELNLARPLLDGEQVRVGLGALPGQPDAGGALPGGVSGAGPGGPDASPPLDLNTATFEQLQELPGVGPVLAQRILDWRTQQGQFTAVEELQEVSGIGEVRYGELRDLVRV
jgi:competence protein ComEA